MTTDPIPAGEATELTGDQAAIAWLSWLDTQPDSLEEVE